MVIVTTKTMRPRDKHDFYPTPQRLCDDALMLLPDSLPVVSEHTKPLIVDPGAGTGVWGIAAKKRWDCNLWGCDIRDIPNPGVYDEWKIELDYNYYEYPSVVSAVIGNPPYKHAEQFVYTAYHSLIPGGHLLFLLRLAFLESQRRGREFFKRFKPYKVYVLVSRPSFISEGDKAGNTDATAYAMFHWIKTPEQRDTVLEWLDWNNKSEQRSLF